MKRAIFRRLLLEVQHPLVALCVDTDGGTMHKLARQSPIESGRLENRSFRQEAPMMGTAFSSRMERIETDGMDFKRTMERFANDAFMFSQFLLIREIR